MKRLLLTLAGVLLVSHASSVQATILLNEIHLNPPSTDGNYEFIELKSTTGGAEFCTNLWILIVENDGGGVGEVKQAWELKDENGAWMSTGKGGLLLLGNDFTEPNSPYQFVKAPLTTMGDPDRMGDDDIEHENAITVLLVERAYPLPIPDKLVPDPLAVPPPPDPDFDVDDDGTGVFDWADSPVPLGRQFENAPWTRIVDSVGFNGDQGNAPVVIKRAYASAAANISRSLTAFGVPQAGASTNFLPATLARSGANNTANDRTAWYGGTIGGTTQDSLTYGANWFNLIPGQTWRGLVTPGQPNLSSAPVAPVFRINEINLNPPGVNDGNFEYIEIINTVANQAGSSNFSGSLAGYTLVMVDSGEADPGRIKEAWDLSRFATGSNGLLVIGDDYGDGFSPFAAAFDPSTQLGDPEPPEGSVRFSSLGAGDISDNGVTFFLVFNFTGLVDGDIDTTPATVPSGDGTAELPLPWATTIDSVSIPEVTALGALVPNRGGYSPAQPDIVVAGTHYKADNLSRIAGNVTPASTAAWSAGQFGSRSPYALSYKNGYYLPTSGGAFRGAASPGAPNYSATSPPVTGTFRLNEVHIDPPGVEDTEDFVEVISSEPHALMRNLWLIVLDATPGGSGVVKKVIDLRGQSTGSNRLAIFSDGIEEEGDDLLELSSPRTLAEDPELFHADGSVPQSPNDSGYDFTSDSITPNEGVSVLLVAYTPTTATGTPAIPNTDLDPGNDGVLDAAPWTLVDGISTGNGVGAVPVVPASFEPGNVSRYLENMTPNSAAAWFGGEITGASLTSLDYGANFFGSFKGAASPGRQNVTATPNEPVGLLLNEVNINPPGGDNEKEFIEVRSADGSAVSANGYSILLIDNDGADTGRVLKAYDLDGAATGTNGLLLAGFRYNAPGGAFTAEASADVITTSTAHGLVAGDLVRFTTTGTLPGGLAAGVDYYVRTIPTETSMTLSIIKDGPVLDITTAGTGTHSWRYGIPWTGVSGIPAPDPATKLFAPDTMAFDDIGGSTDNGAITVLLVKSFTGRVGDDLNQDTTLEDDLIFNPLKWSALSDSVAMQGFVLGGDPPYEGHILQGTADLTATGYTPDSVARYSDRLEVNTDAPWYGGDILGETGTSTDYSETQFFPTGLDPAATVTPGRTNLAAPTEPDIAVFNGSSVTSPELTDGQLALVDFGNTVVPGNTVRTFTIKNSGAASLTGIAVEIGGANAAEFVLTTPPATTLAAGATTTFSVRFTPPAPGTFTANLLIQSNDPTEDPFDLGMTATGVSDDADQDGVPDLMEEALGMDSEVADNYKLPQPSMMTFDNVLQPAYNIVRPTGGAASIDYKVEVAFELAQPSGWTTFVQHRSTIPDSPAPGYETQIYSIHPFALAQFNTYKRAFFRLKVTRRPPS